MKMEKMKKKSIFIKIFKMNNLIMIKILMKMEKKQIYIKIVNMINLIKITMRILFK